MSRDLVALAGEPLRLVVHLGDQRTRGVDRAQVALCRFVVDHRRDAVGGEDHQRPLRHLVGLVDEDRPTFLQVFDDVAVVDDLLAHVHGRSVEVQSLLDGDHRTVDAGAVSARGGEKDTSLSGSHDSIVGGVREATPAEPTALSQSAAPRTLCAVALQTSAEQPAAVRTVAQAVAGWIDRLGAIWVEGQVAQLSRRPGAGMVFLTLRDTAADLSVTVTCSRRVIDAAEPAITEGDRVVIYAKPSFYAARGTFSLCGP